MPTYNQNNQFGDNVMNFGPQPRELNSQLQDQLRQLITNGFQVNITSILGDGEAYNFAHQIKNYLESQGYQVNGVNQAIYSGPVNGQIIEPPKDGDNTYKIIIGTNR